MLRILLIFVISIFSLYSLHSQQFKGRSKPGKVNIKKVIVDKTPPLISIVSPNLKENVKVEINKKQFTITGKVTDNSGILEFLINNEEVLLYNDGTFMADLFLVFGLNTFNLTATDGKLNKTTKTFNIIRRSAVNELKGITPYVTDYDENTNNFHAFIIGVNKYSDHNLSQLDNPINDATALYNLLMNKYIFNKENIIFLKNPNREDIIIHFDLLNRKLGYNDNLLIFYAGHGYWDDQFELGFWLPSDATKDNRARWVQNTTVQNYIGGIRAKHILLITDACFSGSILKTRKPFEETSKIIDKLYELNSRKAITSGTLKEVPDKSIFMEYLIKRLKENKKKYLPAHILFTSFFEAVSNNSPNLPQYGTIVNTGDEGGDFIFIKKD